MFLYDKNIMKIQYIMIIFLFLAYIIGIITMLYTNKKLEEKNKELDKTTPKLSYLHSILPS